MSYEAQVAINKLDHKIEESKFLLACRLFMKCLTGLKLLQQNNPNLILDTEVYQRVKSLRSNIDLLTINESSSEDIFKEVDEEEKILNLRE